MSMRGARRHAADAIPVSLHNFHWDPAVIATLRHSTLPWSEGFAVQIALPAVPLAASAEMGPRDRLSLLAQYAAHQAFLQFAGLADGAFDQIEWVIVRKRGCDCRLVRVAARLIDPAAAPPLLAVAQQFASAIGAQQLDTLRKPWVRAETIYAEVDARLGRDASADRRWLRRSAVGEIAAPGADALRELWYAGEGNYVARDRGAIDTLRAFAQLDPAAGLAVISSSAPLERFGALAHLDAALTGSSISEAEAAERLAAGVASLRHVIVVEEPDTLDAPSRRVLDTVSSLAAAVWVNRTEDAVPLPSSRFFLLSPRLAALKPLEARLSALADPMGWLDAFVGSDDYSRYLESGQLPVDDSQFAMVREPKRSYIAALALLGASIPRELATRFLQEILFDHRLEDLVIPGLTELSADAFSFASETMRARCSEHIAPASRPALCRAAALLADRTRAAFLLIECGEVAEGVALLEHVEWPDAHQTIAALEPLPRSSLSPRLAARLANALTDCGRYAVARDLAPLLDPDSHELLMARLERRTGDYDTALTRLERLPHRSARAELLRAELLRLAGRYDTAAASLASTRPSSEDEQVRIMYEAAVLALDSRHQAISPALPLHHYFGARYQTYEALAGGDIERASTWAQRSLDLARCDIERIDSWLDRIYASFSGGQWTQTREMAIEALVEVDQAEGDRAAAGILYTLAYLAADDGQWQTAEHLIERLRDHFSVTDDVARTFELELLTAHLDFGRGRFAEARRRAEMLLDGSALVKQIREAAALIVDESDWVAGATAALKSSGRSGNRELDDRHRMMQNRRGTAAPLIGRFSQALLAWERGDCVSAPPAAGSRSEMLKLLRSAIRHEKRDLAARIAAELGVDLPLPPSASAGVDVGVLRAAAVADYPFPERVFDDLRWCFASRNRLGHWICDGPISLTPAELDEVLSAEKRDWVRCSDRELLFLEGSDAWPRESRLAVAALFHTRAENHRLKRLIEAEESSSPPAQTASLHGVIGDSPSIRAIFEIMERVARREVPVCVLGESGTGKELVARAIHRASSRRQKPFTAINCAALPENLIESELFGHIRGAFTGADRDRAGLIESAEGGTIFLDEIGEMPLTAQAKLLRFLQDGEFRRVGDTVSRAADVRVVSATNRKLESAVEEGRFREDLYYRVRGVELLLPPLRDRGNDVLLLARHFLAAERARHRAGPAVLSAEVETLFRSYRWPGNVRELQNTIRAAHAMAGDVREVETQHLPERLRNAVPSRVMSGSYQDAVTRFRRDLIEKSLLASAGNQNRAAAMLNMSRQALAYQIRELGILVGKPAARAPM